MLFHDINGNALREELELALEGGAVSVTNRSGDYSETQNTVAALDPDTLEEVKEALGDEMFLLDGIPAVYFDETFPIEVLIECTEKIIELFAPRLVLGISDEIPPIGEIERVRLVSEIVAND